METIVIGDSIFVTVLRIEGGKVKLGIEAPNVVPVNRVEVLRDIGDDPTDVIYPDESECQE